MTDIIVRVVLISILFILTFVIAYIVGKTSQVDERYATIKRFNEWLKKRRKNK